MKRWFISIFVASLVALFFVFSFLLLNQYSITWLGAWLTSASGVIYFIGIYTFDKSPNNINRTKYYSFVFYTGLIITLYGLYDNPVLMQYYALGASVVLVVMWDKYLNWYSVFPERMEKLKLNKPMPQGALQDVNGVNVKVSNLSSKPSVWLFFRGNWCPFCVAQINELANEYKLINDLGYELRFVSSQSISQSEKLARDLNISGSFYTDEKGDYLDKIGLLDHKGLPLGLEILGFKEELSYPAILIIDSRGKIRFIDITDNYRDRPETSIILEELRNTNS